MTQVLLATFAALMVVEATGTGTFLIIYLRDPSWRDTAVGRHLAWYSGALLGLYLTSIASFFIKALWLVLIVLGCHLVFAPVVWQRVRLVWRARRR